MYTVVVENNGSQHYRATSRGYEFLMGQGGANPVETLLAGLSACVAHHVLSRLIARQIAFAALVVKADAELEEDGLAIARVGLCIDLRDAAMTTAERDDLAAQARLCPLYNTLAKAAAMEIVCRSVGP